MAKQKGPKPKPPVVTIMGHVDHGKTTLLDTIRQSKLTSQEHGGITQHIGAYQVTHNQRKITFIDTPGHAAFAKMRARGAKITDLVVLVVAANDGVKPQTKESLAHIKHAGVPFLVAITKTDLPDTDINKVKAQLVEAEVLVEGYGGQTVCVEVSAKTKQGIDQLLEMIILLADMSELSYSPQKPLQAVIVESSLDSKKGPISTLVVQEGMLKVGDNIQAGEVLGKTKRIYNDNGKALLEIGPGDPGQVLGFRSVPDAGSIVTMSKEGRQKKEVKEYKKPYRKITKKEVEEEEKEEKPKEKIKIKFIIKADTLGTLEAIKSNIPDEIELVHSEVGEVNESDVLLAQTSGAQIITFNLRLSKEMVQLADFEKIKIHSYKVIYELMKDLEEKVLDWMEPTINEEILGEGKIIAEFTIKKQHIAGCRVTKGEMHQNSFYRVKRDDQIVAENLRAKSLQKEKTIVEKVKAGNEVGIVLRPDIDFLVGDAIISYRKNK
jgi:translation initiation factor IF-2